MHHDTNETGQTSSTIFGTGSSNDTIKITLPEMFDINLLGKSTTVWYVWGFAASVTATTVADS